MDGHADQGLGAGAAGYRLRVDPVGSRYSRGVASYGSQDLMAGGTEADLPTMDSMAGRLSQSAQALDAVGKSSPSVPNAGDVSGIMGAAIAHLTGSAADLVLGLMGASEEVTRARQQYAGTD